MILLLNCYDPKNPKAGGAELYCSEIFSRLTKDDEVVWIAERFNDSKKFDEYKGIKIIRFGNRMTVLFYAFWFYFRNYKKITNVVDCFHGYPFLTPFYVAKRKRISLIHEIAGKEIWNRLFNFPINILGQLIENVLLSFIYRWDKFVTVSESTENDLMGKGIKDITIVYNGLKRYSLIVGDFDRNPLHKLQHQLIYFGGLRVVMGGNGGIKNIEDLIRAVAIIKKDIPDIKLIITGSKKGPYYELLSKMVSSMNLEENVEFAGFVPDEDLGSLIAESYLAVNASLKEGWGNMVTEAAHLGTPAVTYDVNGHRDILKHGGGVLVKQKSPEDFAAAVLELINDKERYETIQNKAADFANTLDWEKSYEEFKKVIAN